MMKLLPLLDNPLFLKNRYTLCRPATLIAEGTLPVVAFLIMYLGIESGERSTTGDAPTISLAIVQALALLIVAPFRVAAAAALEGQKQTLDFHRTAPTPVVNHVIGLVIGPGMLEWVLAAAIFVVQLLGGMYAGIPLNVTIGFFLCLCVGNLLLCSIAALTAFDRRANRRGSQGAAILLLMVGAWVYMGMGGMIFGSGLRVGEGLLGLNGPFSLAMALGATRLPAEQAAGRAWSGLGMQVLLQGPLILLACLSIRRLLKNPEATLFSKRMVVMSTVVALADLALFAAIDLPDMRDARNAFPAFLITAACVLGVMGTACCTPDWFQHYRGLMRSRKLGRRGPRWHEDDALSLRAMWVVLVLLVAGTGAFHAAGLLVKWDTELWGFLLLLLSGACMAVSFQWAQLRWARQGRLLYVAALLTVWFALPFVGGMAGTESFFALICLSPISGVWMTLQPDLLAEAFGMMIFATVAHLVALAVFLALVRFELERIHQMLPKDS